MNKYAIIYNRVQLEKWYLEDHLTLEEIGEKLHLTRQAVYNRMKRCKIDMSTGERFNVVCDVCGKKYSTTRKRYRSSEGHYCSSVCYRGYIKNEEYQKSRNGMRIARRVMSEALGRELYSGEVVHHIDGDNLNNAPSNLMLFKSSSEHLKHHHHVRRKRIEVKDATQEKPAKITPEELRTGFTESELMKVVTDRFARPIYQPRGKEFVNRRMKGFGGCR